jgi:hypothetical protein
MSRVSTGTTGCAMGHGRKRSRSDKSHNPRCEAYGRVVCGKSARTVRTGGGRKRAHGSDYTGTKPETAETDKSEPTEYRAGPRPYRAAP